MSVVIGERRIKPSGNRYSPTLPVFLLSKTYLKWSSLREKTDYRDFRNFCKSSIFFLFFPTISLGSAQTGDTRKGMHWFALARFTSSIASYLLNAWLIITYLDMHLAPDPISLFPLFTRPSQTWSGLMGMLGYQKLAWGSQMLWLVLLSSHVMYLQYLQCELSCVASQCRAAPLCGFT